MTERPPTPAPDATSATVQSRSTRGAAVIAVAKAYFMVTGLAQPLLLIRALGSAGFGVYGSVTNAVNILNNVVVAGSIQAMSRAVTESGNTALRRGLVLHVLLGTVVATAFALLAEPIGIGVLHDPELPPLLRMASLIAGNYSVYAALVGALNGQQRFRAQAGLDMTFATLRTVLIIGMAYSSYRVAGAIAGFAVASLAITLLALEVVRRGRPAADAAARVVARTESWGAFTRRYFGFFAPVLLYQLALNLVLQADLLVLKALVVRRPGVSLVEANTLVGVYKSVQTFAFLPYQLMLAVTFVVFPVVSRATLDGDRAGSHRFVSGALRFSTLALGAMLSVLVALPERVLRLVYRPDVAVGARALRVLSIGQGAFALGVVATTIALAAGRIAAATLLMLGMLAAVFAGDYVGISLAHTPVDALAGAAFGTTGGCVAGLVAIGVFTARVFGGFVPAATLVRVVVAIAAGCGVAWLPLHGKVMTLVLAVAAVGVYVAVLFVLREVTPSERATLARWMRRRR